MKNFISISILFGLHLVSTIVNAQNFNVSSKFGSPEIRNYKTTEYSAFKQNWGIAHSVQTGKIFSANSKGLLEYDGTNWRIHPLSKYIRSLCVAKDGIIYTGGLGSFGKWKINEKGERIYENLLNDKYPFLNKETIWNIIEIEEGILFQSFAYVFLLTDIGIKQIETPVNIRFFCLANDRPMVQGINGGLYELKNTKMIKIPGSDILKELAVVSILALDPQKILIVTNKGAFIYDGVDFQEFSQKISNFGIKYQFNKACLINENLMALGTISNGIIIADKAGNITTHLNKSSGLQDNTVLALSVDQSGNLWAGLDDGISMINLSSPIRYFQDRQGIIGSVYDAVIYNNRLYIGSNHGLYVSDIDRPELDFELINGTQGQVWTLDIFENELLCGHNEGTFRIEGKKATQISNYTGGWVMKKISPKLLIQGTYTKLIVFEKDKAGHWYVRNEIAGFADPVKQIEQDNQGYIWVNRDYRGISKLKLDADYRTLIKETKFENPFLKEGNTQLLKFKDKICFNTNLGLFSHENGKVLKLPVEYRANRILKTERDYHLIVKNTNDLIFYKDNKRLGSFSYLGKNRLIYGFENIKKLTDELTIICLENGFGLVKTDYLRPDFRQQKATAPKIAFIEVIDFPEYNFYNENQSEIPFHIPYRANNLNFHFAPDNFSKSLNYSYKLDGLQTKWSSFSTASSKTFFALSPGTYTLFLRSNNSTEISQLTFTILPPWYWNIYSQLGYFLALIAIAFLLYQIHHRNLRKHKLSLEKIHQEQVEKKQQKIIKLENEKLQETVIRKSEELANSTMMLVKKNEVLTNLKDEILKRVKEKTLEKKEINDIVKFIDRNISTKTDWKVFETNFNQVHETFLKKLTDLHPNLSHGDLKLAAYLRMNLSSKEIAQLLNITLRSVELKRYRLRKKMDLPGDINLNDYMIKI